MNADQIKRKILKDIQVDLSDEFDKNFSRKAFFTKAWKNRKREGKGSLLQVKGGGGLRGSIKATITGDSITWSSSLEYANIHNEGGEITVTAKMKRFFWAKFYEASGSVKTPRKNKAMSKRSQKFSEEAEFWKAMALKKVGDKVVIPQRQFIGNSPEVSEAISRIASQHLESINQYLKTVLKPRK